jgi:hypothetical protein
MPVLRYGTLGLTSASLAQAGTPILRDRTWNLLGLPVFRRLVRFYMISLAIVTKELYHRE